MKHLIFLLSFVFYESGAGAQQTDTASLKELLHLAETNYPLLKSKALDVQAAQKNIDIGKKATSPSLDAMYQLGYATHNNISGMAYPQYLIPISGPPSSSNNMSGVFGSAASLLLNWQLITFGQKRSQVDFGEASFQYATADATNEIFRHKIKVINAYLDALSAAELVDLYEENVRRTEAGLSMIKTLVITGMKPGVDSALLKAEVSKAKVDLLNSRKFKEETKIILSQLLGSDSISTFSDSSYFTKLPSVFINADTISNPLQSLYKSSIDLSKARRKVLSKTSVPTVGSWSTLYARGSGVSYDGTVKATDGFGLQRVNYGLGVQISFPILQSVKIKPQLQQQDLIIKSNEEKLNEISLQLKKQNELADATISNALAVVKETPLFYESAAYSYRAMLSRYQSGLATLTDLMQVQYALIKAETENKTAYIGVWKALLYKAAVTGDLNLFVNQVN